MTPEQQLADFIAKFTPEIAALAEAVLRKMRTLYPAANQLVYENYNALAIGFGPSERASEAIFSIALYPKRVSLCFLQGGKCNLEDPYNLLHGSGSTNRFIPLATAETLDAPEVREIMSQALSSAMVPLTQIGEGHLIIKSVSAKQRPRRPV